MSKLVIVIPTIRREQYESFLKAWTPLFEKHEATLVTVWDGEAPTVYVQPFPEAGCKGWNATLDGLAGSDRDLFCRFTDACRNIGFVVAAQLGADYVLTLDDDVVPLPDSDPIQDHLDTLNKRVSISWMSAAHITNLFLRGVPYGVRDEAPVMLSHGVWVGTPDFDGETQLRLERNGGVPYTLPYFVGPIPRGTLAAICGMSAMVRKEALPFFYFSPMGPDCGVEGLNRFADIWMGAFLKREFDRLWWACYTGGSTVLHTRASDAKKNCEQEKLGRDWNERIAMWSSLDEIPEYAGGTDIDEREWNYFRSYATKRKRFADLIRNTQERVGS